MNEKTEQKQDEAKPEPQSGAADETLLGGVDRLQRCPFCGGEASFATVEYAQKTLKEQKWGQSKFHYVNCIVCGANTCGLVGQKNKNDAKLKWNKRA